MTGKERRQWLLKSEWLLKSGLVYGCLQIVDVWIWWLICAMAGFRVGGATRRKGDNPTTRQNAILSGFRLRLFAPPTRKSENPKLSGRHSVYFNTLDKMSPFLLGAPPHETRKPDKIMFCRVFAFDLSPRQHEKAKSRNFRGDILFVLTNWIKCRPFYLSPRHTKGENVNVSGCRLRPFAPPTRKDEVKTFRPFAFRYACVHRLHICQLFYLHEGWPNKHLYLFLGIILTDAWLDVTLYGQKHKCYSV